MRTTNYMALPVRFPISGLKVAFSCIGSGIGAFAIKFPVLPFISGAIFSQPLNQDHSPSGA
jgi:hypothetical protein